MRTGVQVPRTHGNLKWICFFVVPTFEKRGDGGIRGASYIARLGKSWSSGFGERPSLLNKVERDEGKYKHSDITFWPPYKPEHTDIYIHTNTHIHMHTIYAYIYKCKPKKLKCNSIGHVIYIHVF